MQNEFLNFIRQKSNNAYSFVDEIADILDISYDAAYRRINGKTSLTFEEGIILAKHFNVSLNKMFEVGEGNTITATSTNKILNAKDLEQYFVESQNNFKLLAKLKNTTLFYLAKDLPFFHVLKDFLWLRFKIFTWMKQLDKRLSAGKISFTDFNETITKSLIENAVMLGKMYESIDISELWNDNTISMNLHQIIYSYDSNLLSKTDANQILEDIVEVLNNIEQKTISQNFLKMENKSTYKLYQAEFPLVNNSALVVSPIKKIFYQSYTVMDYFIIEDQATCEFVYEFVMNQLSSSKLLATAGEKDRILFFNKIRQKIALTKEYINSDKEMTFL